MIIQMPEFAPDMPDVPSKSSDVVFNVLPVTPISYGQCPSHQPFATALDARSQGSLSVLDSAGTSSIFTGDVSKLYRITAASIDPADVSRVAGYTTSPDGGWYFTQFGNRVIATNYNDPPQSFVSGTDTIFSDMITSGLTSLKAKYAVSVKDFVVLGNTTDSTYGTRPQRVHWSAINDPTNFPTPGTVAAANALSDFQDNAGTHGDLVGIAGNLGTADAGLFYQRAVYRMVWSGQPDVFQFYPAEGARGLLVDGGLTQFGSIAYYIGEDGFYAFDGSQSRAIGKNKIDKFFYNDALPTYLNRTTCCVDPQRGLIVFAYAGIGATGGIPNRLLFYSPFFDKWTATEANEIQISSLVRGATFNQTLENLDDIGTVDSIQFSFDSPVFAGGKSVLSAFDSSDMFGYFDGESLAPKIETADIELIQGRTSQTSRVRPLCDSLNVTVAGAGRQRVQDVPSFSAGSSIELNGSVSLRTRGRYHRYRIQTPAGDTWSHISGLDIEDVADMGAR